MDPWSEFLTGHIWDWYPDGALDLIDTVYSPEFNIKALVWDMPLEKDILGKLIILR